MRTRDNPLFYEGDLAATLRGQSESITEQINAMPKNQFLSTPEEDLREHYYQVNYVDPLKIYEENMEMEQNETRIDVSRYADRNPFRREGPIYVQGIKLKISIPFTGDPMLWKLRPNSWQTTFPRAIINQPIGNDAGYIEFIFQHPSDSQHEILKSEFDSELKSIRFYIDAQLGQINAFNQSLPALIEQAIGVRKKRLELNEAIAGSFGIPLKRRDGAPSVTPIQIKRTLVKPLPTPKSEFKPEPGITEKDYEHILSVIRHEGRTFEVTPTTYAVHPEEELRDIILAHLNGHYQGEATGETFRRNGKTDIRIEDNDRAAFVGECKVWRGAKELSDAVDQLLGYLTWRDCKASIIIFNKNVSGFTEILQKIPEVFEGHKNFKHNIEVKYPGEWRYIFSSQEDELRLITINVFAFNLFVGK